MTVEEFAGEFFQDVLAEADADGQFVEDVFFHKFCEHLMEVGELDSADRVAYQGQPRRGIRVDGYGGDPAEDDSDTFSLLISDFHPSADVGRLIGSEMNTIFRRLSNFLRHALDRKWRDALEETSPAFGLADLLSKRWSSISRVRLFLITNRELSERVDGREADELDGRTITYSVWDIGRLYRQATVGHGREDIDVDLTEGFGGPLPVLPARQQEAEHESYLAVMPGKVLAAIYDRWGTRLLEQNVRVFLQHRGKVNKGIRATLENEPSMFFAYNNGITATAEEVEIDDDRGRLLLRRLKNFQIVNGGQTTASVHAAQRGKVDVSQTFVQMKLSVVDPERANSLVPKISEFANSQNRVSAADFFANHPFHVRMEGFSRRIHAPSPDGTFRQSKWFYERARGQYADARAGLTSAQRRKFDLENPRWQLFTKTDLAKFVNVWEGRPDEVSRGAQKNFAGFARRIGQAWRNAPDDFNEAWYREAVAKAIVFRATERLVSEQPWYQGGYRANIVAYAIAKTAHDTREMERAVDFEAIWHRQALPAAMGQALVAVAESVHGVLVAPPAGISNVTEWAKKQMCWKRVSELVIAWPRPFLDDLISTDERRDVVRGARREQRQLNSVEKHIAVVNAGPAFWADALAWGTKRELLTPTEVGVLGVVAVVGGKTPTERQASKAVEALSKLQSEGYAGDLLNRAESMGDLHG